MDDLFIRCHSTSVFLQHGTPKSWRKASSKLAEPLRAIPYPHYIGLAQARNVQKITKTVVLLKSYKKNIYEIIAM